MKFIVDTTAHDVKHARRMVESFQGNGYFSFIAVRRHAGIITAKRNQELMTSARERADHWYKRAEHLERVTHQYPFFNVAKDRAEYTTGDGLGINGIAFNALLEDVRKRLHARIDAKREQADLSALYSHIFYNIAQRQKFAHDLHLASMAHRYAGGPRPKGAFIVGEHGREIISGGIRAGKSILSNPEAISYLMKGSKVVQMSPEMQTDNHYADAIRYAEYTRKVQQRALDRIKVGVTPTKIEPWDWQIDVNFGPAYTSAKPWYSKIFEYIAGAVVAFTEGIKTIWPKEYDK